MALKDTRLGQDGGPERDTPAVELIKTRVKEIHALIKQKKGVYTKQAGSEETAHAMGELLLEGANPW